MDDEQNIEQGTGDTPTELPTDLTALSDDELDTARGDARAEADALAARPAAELTEDEVQRLEALAQFLGNVAAEDAARDAAAEERAQRAQAAAEAIAGQDGGDGEEGEEGDGSDDGTGDGGGEEEGDGEEAPTAVAAAGRRTQPTRRMRARRNPAPAERQGASVFTITAAAGLRGAEAGGELASMREVAEQFIARADAFPKGRATTKHVRHDAPVATIHRNFANRPDGLYQGNPDFADDMAILAAAADETRLKDNSLVAAGGWCAPSETIYTLTSDETLDGIIDLPTIGAPRGGINFTLGPDFADIYTDAGFHQTEAEAIAGDTKPCTEVDCPDFDEVRLDAVGICVKAPLLTRSAYPELVERWLNGTVTANAHKVAASIISSMRTALGTALAPVLTGTPVTWSTLTALELVGEGQRQAYRLGDGQTLEVVAPRWLRIAIRADLSNRPGYPQDPSQVTNQMIDAHFAARGLRVQWVLNYLELASPLTNITFPDTVEVMVYPAGAFVKGEQSVINLNTIYDTADLQTNVYTAAFVEDGVFLAKMKYGGKRITLPVNVNGMVGAAQLDDNWGTAQVETAGV